MLYDASTLAGYWTLAKKRRRGGDDGFKPRGYLSKTEVEKKNNTLSIYFPSPSFLVPILRPMSIHNNIIAAVLQYNHNRNQLRLQLSCIRTYISSSSSSSSFSRFPGFGFNGYNKTFCFIRTRRTDGNISVEPFDASMPIGNDVMIAINDGEKR